ARSEERAHTRGHQGKRGPHALPPDGKLQHPADDAGDTLPVRGFGGELLAADSRNGIELRLAVVFRCSPRGRDPALLHEPDKAEIDGALVYSQRISAELLDTPGDAVSVQRSHGGQGLQHHQVERALEDLRFSVRHTNSPLLWVL